MLHKNISLSEIHKIHNWEVSDATARNALSVTSGDIGKIAWQTDNDTYWALKNNSPVTWNTLGKDGSPVSNLDFNTATTATDSVARLKWNDVDGTLEVGLKGGQSTLQIGQEIVKRIYNNTGSTLTDGQVVYVTGASAGRLTVALADADFESTSHRTIGVVTETIANNSEGFITVFGFVRGLNTSSFNEGDLLYLSGTPGVYTNVEPVAPQHRVIVGFVIRKNASNGSIFISINNGYELNELHDILISSVTDGQVLAYDSATGTWKNVSISGVGSDTSYPTRVVTTSTSISNLDYTIRCNCSSNDITINLPAASTLSGYVFNIKKIDNTSNKVFIQANSVEEIDGTNVAEIEVQYVTLTIQSNGTSWDII